MITDSTFLFRKLVDKSVLYQGFNVSVKYFGLLQAVAGQYLEHGETRPVKIWLEDKEYDATLVNQGFDMEKYKGHHDILQVRYETNSPICQRIQQIFHATKEYVDPLQAVKKKGDRSPIRIPEEIREYLVFQATSVKDVFMLDCITCQEAAEVREEIKKIPEYTFETPQQLDLADPSAGYGISKALGHYRKLDKSVGDTLKRAYDFTCQVTGEKVGDPYGTHVVEAHHIDPFTTSLNNDSNNIIILSPTFHRIVHKAKPHFNRKTLSFEFPNGVVEQVKCNIHLH